MLTFERLHRLIYTYQLLHIIRNHFWEKIKANNLEFIPISIVWNQNYGFHFELVINSTANIYVYILANNSTAIYVWQQRYINN